LLLCHPHSRIYTIILDTTNVTVDDKTGKTKDYIFRVCFIDPFQGTLMAQFAADNLNAKNAVIYCDNSSDYGKGLAQYFEKTFTEKGGVILAKEGFVKDDRDFRATLTKIKSLNPDFIYVPGYYQEVAPLIKQARELGITVPIGGCDGWDSPDMVSVAGPEALNNTYFTNHYSSQDKDPKVVKFVEAFKAKYNKDPDAFAALGYDSVQIMVQGLKDAGEADPVKLKEALEKIKDFEGVTGKMSIDDQHNPVKAGVIIEFKDGKQVMNTRIQP
ncbi:MAG TPA: ABC transporter substrate-binding protein, partial [Bacillota bacterium]|nr:ABC transporter substrate-binding protein [Bacillota bacterium]